MRVLIACEFSGIVRDAFIERGHDATSCDLLPTERPGPHIRGDVLDLLYDEWGYPSEYALTIDLLIAHPPCTYLANSGVRWLYGGRGSRRPRVHHASPGPDRWKERSRTLQGIADAMVDQWGSLALESVA